MILAYTCPSRYQGPHPCGAVEFWVSQAWAWLLFGMVLVGVAFWLFAWAYGKWDDRPAARRRRALDRAAAERERAARPPVDVPEAFRRRSGNQPW